MLNLGQSTKYVTVFEVKVNEKYVQANLSTSKKNEDGKYQNMSWKARFVGKAFEPAKALNDKDKIEVLKGAIENNFAKEKNKLWINVVIFEFNVMV